MVLYLRHVSDMLALVCVLREESYGKRAMLDYNIDCLKDSLAKVIAVSRGQG
jgi:Ras-related GTP-binding protein C/D